MDTRIDESRRSRSTAEPSTPKTTGNTHFREQLGSAGQAAGARRGPLPEREHGPRRSTSPQPRGARPASEDGERPALMPPGMPLGGLGFRLEPPVVRPGVGHEAERVALMERQVESLRVGRVGDRGHEARLRLVLGGGTSAVEVHLRHDGAGLSACVLGDDERSSGSLARRIQRELEEAGLEADVSAGEL